MTCNVITKLCPKEYNMTKILCSIADKSVFRIPGENTHYIKFLSMFVENRSIIYVNTATDPRIIMLPGDIDVEVVEEAEWPPQFTMY